MKEDMYTILGVSRQASLLEIKRAYYRLAKRWHPDVSSAKDAESRFQRLNDAYHILTDPRKRRLYDLGLDLNLPKQKRQDYYRYGTSVRNPTRAQEERGDEAEKSSAPVQARRSFLDHFLFASLLFLGLTALIYGILDAIFKEPDDSSRFLGLVLGLAFTAMLLLGWHVLSKESPGSRAKSKK